MASPITWQNVTSPSNAGIFRGIEAANTAINSGFDQFNKVLQQRLDSQVAAEAAQSNRAKQNLLDALQGATTPEQLAALQASGQLDQYRQGMLSSDRDATRGAADARLASIRKAFTDQDAFNQAQTAVNDRIPMAAARQAILDGNQEAFNTALGNMSPGAQAILMREQDDRKQLNTERERATENHNEDLRGKEFVNDLREYQVKGEKQKYEDDADLRRGQKLVDKLQTDYRNSVNQGWQAATSIGQSMGFAVDPNTGRLNVGAMTTEEQARVNAALAEQGGLSLDTLQRGDAAAYNNAVAAIDNSDLTAKTKATLKESLKNNFNTVAPTDVGNTAAFQKRIDQERETRAKQVNAQYGQLSADGNREEIEKAIPEIVSEFVDKDSDAYEGFISRISEAVREGIPVKLGNGEVLNVPPSKATIREWIASAPKKYEWANSRSGFARSLDQGILNWQQDPENLKGATEMAKVLYRNIHGRDLPIGNIQSVREYEQEQAKIAEANLKEALKKTPGNNSPEARKLRADARAEQLKKMTPEERKREREKINEELMDVQRRSGIMWGNPAGIW